MSSRASLGVIWLLCHVKAFPFVNLIFYNFNLCNMYACIYEWHISSLFYPSGPWHKYYDFQFGVFMEFLSKKMNKEVSASLSVSCDFYWAPFLLFVTGQQEEHIWIISKTIESTDSLLQAFHGTGYGREISLPLLL